MADIVENNVKIIVFTSGPNTLEEDSFASYFLLKRYKRYKRYKNNIVRMSVAGDFKEKITKIKESNEKTICLVSAGSGSQDIGGDGGLTKSLVDFIRDLGGVIVRIFNNEKDNISLDGADSFVNFPNYFHDNLCYIFKSIVNNKSYHRVILNSRLSRDEIRSNTRAASCTRRYFLKTSSERESYSICLSKFEKKINFEIEPKIKMKLGFIRYNSSILSDMPIRNLNELLRSKLSPSELFTLSNGNLLFLGTTKLMGKQSYVDIENLDFVALDTDIERFYSNEDCCKFPNTGEFEMDEIGIKNYMLSRLDMSKKELISILDAIINVIYESIKFLVTDDNINKMSN